MKKLSLIIILLGFLTQVSAQNSPDDTYSPKWGVELNLLWPIFPGNIYKGQVTYETWRTDQLAGDVYLGFHIRPFEFREREGDFSNYALTFGYRQFIWERLHLELYQAFGPGFNRNNAIDGKNYNSWDYEVGFLAGYRYEFKTIEKKDGKKITPYLSSQHGMFYLAAQSNPHPIVDFEGERPFYVGTLNLGVRF
ncbi:MAG: hypothetical protein H6606_01335 [Flavobacteriales bacterium]|nr:hypothetical protein [Flavobacteriales bacterium]